MPKPQRPDYSNFLVRLFLVHPDLRLDMLNHDHYHAVYIKPRFGEVLDKSKASKWKRGAEPGLGWTPEDGEF